MKVIRNYTMKIEGLYTTVFLNLAFVW